MEKDYSTQSLRMSVDKQERKGLSVLDKGNTVVEKQLFVVTVVHATLL